MVVFSYPHSQSPTIKAVGRRVICGVAACGARRSGHRDVLSLFSGSAQAPVSLTEHRELIEQGEALIAELGRQHCEHEFRLQIIDEHSGEAIPL